MTKEALELSRDGLHVLGESYERMRRGSANQRLRTAAHGKLLAIERSIKEVDHALTVVALAEWKAAQEKKA